MSNWRPLSAEAATSFSDQMTPLPIFRFSWDKVTDIVYETRNPRANRSCLCCVLGPNIDASAERRIPGCPSLTSRT